MTKLPRNPTPIAELRRIGPELCAIAAGTLFARVYFHAGDHPADWNTFRHYGPVNARFDHHPEPPGLYPEHGIYYAAGQLVTCLAETFQDTRVIHRTRRRPWFVAFETARELTLLDMTKSWPTRAGASMKINTGPRPVSRAWSRQFYDAFPLIDGLYYASSMHANRPCIALYERAQNAIPAAPFYHCPLSDRVLRGDMKRAAAELGYALL